MSWKIKEYTRCASTLLLLNNCSFERQSPLPTNTAQQGTPGSQLQSMWGNTGDEASSHTSHLPAAAFFQELRRLPVSLQQVLISREGSIAGSELCGDDRGSAFASLRLGYPILTSTDTLFSMEVQRREIQGVRAGSYLLKQCSAPVFPCLWSADLRRR